MTSTEKIKKRYNRISSMYDLMDKMIKDSRRAELLKSAKGNVLEVGIGTGANLPFYPNNITLTGVDFSPGMLKHARKRLLAERYDFSINLLEADIEKLPFQDDSFDTIVSTCVFCSVPNPQNGLRELKRVCKPDGKIIMLEHMRSENKALGLLMDLLNPLTVNLWGANINRRTIENIHKVGLTIENEEKLMGSIFRSLSVHK